MYTKFDVLETIDMVAKEHLDIRTITMGISLFPCVRDTAEATAAKVYDLVCSRAEKIVKTAADLSGEYGIPIVNKRVSVTPVSLISAAFPEKAPLIARALDEAAERLGIDFLGGYSALVHKSAAPYEKVFLDTVPEVLASTKRLWRFRQCRLHPLGHQHGRRTEDGRHFQAGGRADRGGGRPGGGKAGRFLQRRGG